MSEKISLDSSDLIYEIAPNFTIQLLHDSAIIRTIASVND